MNNRNIAPSHPAETLTISPEGLEVANNYLQCQNIAQVSENLNVPMELVTQILDRREVKAFIDNVFKDYGFNNQFRLRKILDKIIEDKLKDMEANDAISGKDIADLLALSAKITNDHLKLQIDLAKEQNKTNIKNQLNVQINDAGSNYGNLMQDLLNPKHNVQSRN